MLIGPLQILTLLLITLALVAQGCRYDSSPLMYNPSGRVLQIENAKACVERGEPVVGVLASDGLILVTTDFKTGRTIKGQDKFVLVDEHCYLACSGFAADSVALAKVAKVLCAKYKRDFGSNIPIENLSDQLADWLHAQTRKGSTRPLGVEALVAGLDEEMGFQIYTVEPQGALWGWRVVCVGGNNCARNRSLLESSFPRATRCTIDEVWSKITANRGELLAALFAGDRATNTDDLDASPKKLQLSMCSRRGPSGALRWDSRQLEIGAVAPSNFI